MEKHQYEGVIIPIPTEIALRIFDENKNSYAFRGSYRFLRPKMKVLIYASRGIGAIIGETTIDQVFTVKFQDLKQFKTNLANYEELSGYFYHTPWDNRPRSATKLTILLFLEIKKYAKTIPLKFKPTPKIRYFQKNELQNLIYIESQ